MADINTEQENNNTSTVETKEDMAQQQEPPKDLSVELKAALELAKESQETIKQLQKELQDVKVANAKLAITQTIGAPKSSAEEILNKMFK